jgi:hypothetical protein
LLHSYLNPKPKPLNLEENLIPRGAGHLQARLPHLLYRKLLTKLSLSHTHTHAWGREHRRTRFYQGTSSWPSTTGILNPTLNPKP